MVVYFEPVLSIMHFLFDHRLTTYRYLPRGHAVLPAWPREMVRTDVYFAKFSARNMKKSQKYSHYSKRQHVLNINGKTWQVCALLSAKPIL